jgi:hypothetical protein
MMILKITKYETLFQDYQLRGIQSRSDLIITREERDADLLVCDGENIPSPGNLNNYYVLDETP